MRGLEGRTAVVTGGARGLGKAAAERLAEEGVKVGILDLRGDEAQEVAQAIGGAGFQCDTTNEEQLAAAFEGVNAQLGGVDILVNNAGLIAPRREWTTWTKEEVERFAEVNYIGYFLAIKAAYPYLKASGRGRIINVASRTFFMGNPGQTPYVSAKGAVIGLSWNMAKELGRRQHHRQRRDAGTGRDPRHAGVQRRGDVQPHDAEPGDQGARLPGAPRLAHRLPRQRRRLHDLRPVHRRRRRRPAALGVLVVPAEAGR